LDRVFRAVRLAAECRIENSKCSLDRVRELLGDKEIALLCARLSAPEAVNGRTESYGAGPLPEVRALREHTTSLSAVDRDGNAVCLTQSLGSMYGSGVVIPETGVCMNNFLNWGDLNPASPNYLKGGERFGMCLAPSISLADGEFALALGTPGSYGILQTQAQAIVHHRVYGLDLQAAIDAPRARLWDGRRVDLENRIEAPVVEALRAQGHEINLVNPFSMFCGGMQAISRDRETGVLSGAADSRRDGAAMPL
jgi:gamma-glutamyltranspeptidase/glutathione hydrolase